MPVIKCKNGKYKYGKNGSCIFKTEDAAKKAGQAIEILKRKNDNYGRGN